ncbi:MAG: hypothetical protein JSS88_13030 [Actinobacteria bacterium]|nr:hypothetical protein [Actinomycetota bacterium]
MEHEEAPFTVAGGEGAPVSVRKRVGRPLLVLAAAAVVLFGGWEAAAAQFAPASVVAAAVLVSAAVVLAAFGELAYRDLTSGAIDRYVLAWAGSLFACGVALSFGVIGWIPLAGAGWVLAGQRFAPVRRIRRAMPHRRWRTTVTASAATGVVCILLLPLAVGLGSLPLIVIVMAGRIVAPLFFGFALRCRGRTTYSGAPADD